jgi:hypothetical protein
MFAMCVLLALAVDALAVVDVALADGVVAVVAVLHDAWQTTLAVAVRTRSAGHAQRQHVVAVAAVESTGQFAQVEVVREETTAEDEDGSADVYPLHRREDRRRWSVAHLVVGLL